MAELRLQLRVRAVCCEAEGINSYDLVDPKEADLPPFTAGAHIDVHLPGNVIRQYSLCNDPRERHRYVVAVLREATGRGGSQTMHRDVRAGDLLAVSAPRNNFPLAETAARHLLIAGGIGVTPLVAMIHRLQSIGADFTLHYCTRAPEKTAFTGALAALIRAGRVIVHHDYGNPANGLDVARLLAQHAPGTHLYCCGPSGLMAAVKSAAAGWPAGTLHFEYFAAPAVARDPAAAGEFQVRVASTGQLIAIPKDKSILETLREHGLSIESSCEAGACGTCQTRYLDGEPDHRDYVLTDEDQKKFLMVCVSRAKSAILTLDL
jgi:vanillate O-demethylase ferredoxin subunit